MKILTRCMEKMKTVCAAMLDPRRGKNIRHTMQGDWQGCVVLVMPISA